MISIENASVIVFESEEALLSGEASVLSSNDDFFKFKASESVFLVAEFTSDVSSFLIEFRRI